MTGESHLTQIAFKGLFAGVPTHVGNKGCSGLGFHTTQRTEEALYCLLSLTIAIHMNITDVVVESRLHLVGAITVWALQQRHTVLRRLFV